MQRGGTVSTFILLVALLGAGCGTSDSDESAVAGTDSAKEEQAQAKQAAPARRQPPEVTLHTTSGDIRVLLDPKNAPLTVQNFLDYVDAGQYENTIFHQVVDDFIVLGGGFTPELDQKPTRHPIRNEAHRAQPNRRYTVAMARRLDGIDSSTCQFFINLADNPSLDHRGDTSEDYGYCVFGEVIEGEDVVETIGRSEVTNQEQFELIPVEPVVIRSVERVSGSVRR